MLDARGGRAGGADLGWQKFVGQLLTIPPGATASTDPIVMDATVDQPDGYRFVYCLPFAPTELFVEDTYYTDAPDLDRAALTRPDRRLCRRARLAGRRAQPRGNGVLPVVIGGDFDSFWPAARPGRPRRRSRGGFFHPLTSYSLPDAVRFAVVAGATRPPLDAHARRRDPRPCTAHWKSGRFLPLARPHAVPGRRPAGALSASSSISIASPAP